MMNKMTKNEFNSLCAYVCKSFAEFKRECEALLTANETAEAAYQRGLNDAWEAAKKLYMADRAEACYMLGLERERIFDGISPYTEAFTKFTASETLTKIREYEERKKTEAEAIKVGDEIVGEEAHVVVTWADGDEWNGVLLNDCENGEAGHCYTCMKSFSGWRKTGRHFPQIAEVLGEIRNTDGKEGT